MRRRLSEAIRSLLKSVAMNRIAAFQLASRPSWPFWFAPLDDGRRHVWYPSLGQTTNESLGSKLSLAMHRGGP